ncbi:alpha-galactosidase [Paenibacillus cymbidii]|uniref:hypothetical protein n=1 Tax=Paenibacillus cymbidii TaxID=1639034 RepID=UPI00107FDAE4|nr:hypothetical protein [Paenibacillus cymbidii]
MKTADADKTAITLGSKRLRRKIEIHAGGAGTVSLTVDGEELLSACKEFSFQVKQRTVDAPPRGIDKEKAPVIETTAAFTETDFLAVTEQGVYHDDSAAWGEPLSVDGSGCDARMKPMTVTHERETDERGIERHRFAMNGWPLPGHGSFAVALVYEAYPSDAAVRKRIEVRNDSPGWLKLEQLLIDDIQLAGDNRSQVELTPSERGAKSSILAFGNAEHTRGVLVCSEVPSALREMNDSGGTGYADSHFEWVLAPGETFVSEAVFLYAYYGTAVDTGAGISRPLDRTVERDFVPFLQRELGVSAPPVEKLAPAWCSWSNFGNRIDDAIVREQAGIAAKCGFATIILDQGWQRGLLGTEPDTNKFPDFHATSAFIRSCGLQLGLWVSCFRDPDSKDMTAMPRAEVLPLLKRIDGYGMSFASPWRYYYADDLAALAGAYGAIHFKQDFTNVKFGDIADGHESRTRKESLLRGLRGLLEAQRLVSERAPGAVPELTHEIYWGTPGTPCDIAALRHAGMYHIPPNDYSGAGHQSRRFFELDRFDPETLRQGLIRGCFNARMRLYAHRGLPLCSINYYGAATISVRGSLTPDVQDRQLCSWLMGAPLLYAGDLSSLTEEHAAHYRQRFDLLARLQRDYGIYRHFQYSGVPEPTDTDWHWWGKLNGSGEGAVVVIRGSHGAERRPIVIPWVDETHTYRVHALLGSAALGTFTGKQLQNGALVLALPAYGQELLELARATGE